MFKALLRKQLMEMSAFLTNDRKTGKRRSRKATAGYTLLFGVILITMMGSFSAMALPLAQLLLPEGMDWLYFLSMELTALMMGVIVGAFAGYSGLFAAKDNELLLSMPIPPWMILAVRLFSLLATNVGCILLVWIPTVLIYAVYAEDPLGAVLSAIPMAVLIGGISALLSAILGWIVAKVSGYVRHKNAVTVVLSLAFLGGYYIAVQKIQMGLQSVLVGLSTDADAAARAGILYEMGCAAQGDGRSLLMLAVTVAAAVAAFCFLLGRRYLSLMTTHRGIRKTVYRAKMTRKVSLRNALLRRELLHLASSPAYLLNCSLGSVLLVVAGGVMLGKAEEIRVSASETVPAEFLPHFLCAIVCCGLASNLLAAPSVSLEGNTLWLIRSLPVTAWQALRAKLELHLLVTGLPAVFCVLCGGVVFRIGIGEMILVLLVVLLFLGFAALFDLTAGLLWTNLHWTNETAVIKQSLSTGVAMLGGWTVSLLLTAGGFLLLHVLPGAGVLVLCMILLSLLDALLLRWVRGPGSKRFEELV